MKMIYVGSLSKQPDRDSGWISAFAGLGWDVVPYAADPVVRGPSLLRRFKRRFGIGSEYRAMRSGLVELANREKPLWVHFRLPIEFDRDTILELKRRGIVVTEYFNDDPFSSRAPFGLHWKFRRALSAYDGHFVYRARNVSQFVRRGGLRVEHCPPTYDSARHNLEELRRNEPFLADATFIGHCEGDWRVRCLDALRRAGFKVLVKGGGWDDAVEGTALADLRPIQHAFGPEYNRLYANSIAGLCFFSKINNDSWTERALEIVAVGGVLVCERTAEAETYFVDREEAFLFSTIEELVGIVSLLKNDPERRELTRCAAHRRLTEGADGHTVADRARRIDSLARSLLSRT